MILDNLLAGLCVGSGEYILFLIKDNKTEIDSRLNKYISTENPSWNTYDSGDMDSISGLISKIPERQEKEPGKTILRKSVQKLKNGKFSLSYNTTI